MLMPASALSWCCLLVMLTSAAAAPWNVGDIFATTYGRVHVINSKTLQVKQTINIIARNGTALCPGKISGGDFDHSGTVLYLACESHSKILVIDATSTRQHKVLDSILTVQPPSGLTVGRNGTLYVSHSNKTLGAVFTYSPQAKFLGQLWAGNQTITGLKLNAAEDQLLTTSAGSQVHQFSIGGNIDTKQAPTSMTVESQGSRSKCYGLDIPQDGSILVACKSCVYHISYDATGTGNMFCPARNRTALKHIALDPTKNFFYVADAIHNEVHKVSLRDWKSTANFTVPGIQNIQGLMVFNTVDVLAFQKGRKQAEAEWTQAVQKAKGQPKQQQQQQRKPPKAPAAANPATPGPATHDSALNQPPAVPTQHPPAGTAGTMPSNSTAAQPTEAARQPASATSKPSTGSHAASSTAPAPFTPGKVLRAIGTRRNMPSTARLS